MVDVVGRWSLVAAVALTWACSPAKVGGATAPDDAAALDLGVTDVGDAVAEELPADVQVSGGDADMPAAVDVQSQLDVPADAAVPGQDATAQDSTAQDSTAQDADTQQTLDAQYLDINGDSTETAADAGPSDTAQVDELPADLADSLAGDLSDGADDSAVDAGNGGGDDVDAGDLGVDMSVFPTNTGSPGDPSFWVPHWKDIHGCENYQYYQDGKCLDQNPAQKVLEQACWYSNVVNDLGIGKPCQPGVVECTGQAASCCMVDQKKYGAICVSTCDFSKPNNGCGPGAWCHASGPKGPGINVCLPNSCEPLLLGLYTASVKSTLGFACPSGQVGSDGVGATCIAGGSECLNVAFDPDSYCLGSPSYYPWPYSSFCTHPCETDVDCGQDAACIHSNGKPYFCSPTACAAQFDGLLFTNGAENDTKELAACLNKP